MPEACRLNWVSQKEGNKKKKKKRGGGGALDELREIDMPEACGLNWVSQESVESIYCMVPRAQ